MTYRLAFGVDTESLEDPSQLVLVDLPDECDLWDSDGVIDYINTHGVPQQPLVGLHDVLDSMGLAMQGEGLSPEVVAAVRGTILDAVFNNAFL